ncbi:MAG: hypothetical protein WC789_03105 [Lentisphaeria bacterium]
MTDPLAATSAHTFHIPVMGTGFTIDSPLKVARFGITSVISLVDDVLIEQMREHHSRAAGEPFTPIRPDEPDSRARRIQAYLDFLGRRVAAQVRALQAAPFVPGSEIARYFEWLPEEAPAKELYRRMLATAEPAAQGALQERLRRLAIPGGIDVNIMTKLEGDSSRGRNGAAPDADDARSALRGFATSSLESAVVFSAGLNRPLYGYAARFADFLPSDGRLPRKRIILKVSDFRSAVIQGTFFAKHGLWLSEFRVESGLNCGGHAFATKGLLMGPILAEFKAQRAALLAELRAHYLEALRRRAVTPPPAERLGLRITAQGGIGTAAEDRLLRSVYHVAGTGWGTPFMLVPEAVSIDPESLRLLAAATAADVELSDNSPLGVPFWNLRASASEQARRQRIRDGRPGAPCRKGFALFNTELTEQPVCVASHAYQSLKLRQLADNHPGGEPDAAAVHKVVTKACICHDLAGCATLSHGLDPAATPAVCCGPNIAWFHRVASLEEMVGHIYGRLSLLGEASRPHLFINELSLYVAELRRQAAVASQDASGRLHAYLRDFRANLLAGIAHYRGETARFLEAGKARFLQELAALEAEVQGIQDGVGSPLPA